MRFISRVFLMTLVAAAIATMTSVNINAQRARANTAAVVVTQQPLVSDYKGLRLGMSAEQVRAKLGEPALKADDQDYYIISATETAQFAYDAKHKVVTISVDYSGPTVPDYRNITGPVIDQRPDGSLYKVVRYEAQGFWVSYNRTANGIVTVTIQRI